MSAFACCATIDQASGIRSSSKGPDRSGTGAPPSTGNRTSWKKVAISIRFPTASFDSTRCTWLFTVCSAIWSWMPICRLLIPRTKDRHLSLPACEPPEIKGPPRPLAVRIELTEQGPDQPRGQHLDAPGHRVDCVEHLFEGSVRRSLFPGCSSQVTSSDVRAPIGPLGMLDQPYPGRTGNRPARWLRREGSIDLNVGTGEGDYNRSSGPVTGSIKRASRLLWYAIPRAAGVGKGNDFEAAM